MRLSANSLSERVWREDVGSNFVYISFTTPKSTNLQRRNNYIYSFRFHRGLKIKLGGCLGYEK
jgi:hypothetical protein